MNKYYKSLSFQKKINSNSIDSINKKIQDKFGEKSTGIGHFVRNTFNMIMELSSAQIEDEIGVLKKEKKDFLIKKSYNEMSSIKNVKKSFNSNINRELATALYDAGIKSGKQIINILDIGNQKSKNNSFYKPLSKTNKNINKAVVSSNYNGSAI